MSSRWVRSVVPAVLFAGFTSGCALLMPTPEHVGGRATLGDAALAARPDSAKKQRSLRVGYTVPPEPGETVTPKVSGLALDSGEGGTPSSAGRRRGGGASDRRGVLGIVAGGGTIGGTRYDGFGEFGLSLGYFDDPRIRIDLIGTVSPIQFADQTLAGESFVNEFDLNLDATVRYYLTAPHTFVGVYPILGARTGTMFWDFAKPVTIREDGKDRTVKSDWINHFSFYGGLGVSPIQLRHFSVGISLLGGVRTYSAESSNGFSNTLFPDVGFVQMRVEAGYRF